jgi:hypothetical protein
MKQEQYIWIDEYGNKCYYKDQARTILHRHDGPAIEWSNGSKEWWVDGKLHRLDGPAMIWANGDKAWYVDSKLHRTDGPAVIWSSGSKLWYVDDKRHRLDGPAVEWPDGDKEWWVDGEYLTEEQFNALTAPTLELTLEDIAAKYGVDVSKVKIKK